LGAFRKAWQWYSEDRKMCLKADKCAKCGGKGKLYADHVEPVVDIRKGWRGWDVHFERMFGGRLQPLCKGCHDAKSKTENALRRAADGKHKG
jgi:5-methylcytosine-specific restriction endonuclease McrA